MNQESRIKGQKAYVVAMDMGYGHQRAAYPLRVFAKGGKVLYADCYRGIPKRDHETWRHQREFYNFISRFKGAPVVGELAFSVFDYIQEIEPFYPKRDLSKPTLQVKSTYNLIRNKKWGEHLIKVLNKKPLPFVTTFFVPAYMAEEHGYKGEIYMVVADADIARAWAPLRPALSKIKYLVPTKRVYERLKVYGVKEQNIFLTGFPLPLENIGNVKLNVLKRDLGRRLWNLDPAQQYMPRYRATLEAQLGRRAIVKKRSHPFTILFAVGGAGGQREIGIEIARSLRERLRAGTMRLVLVAGIHNDVKQYFRKELHEMGLSSMLGRSVVVLASQSKDEYFRKFNHALHTTDILWTKPSELSFYCALGLPIIMSEPVGSQEKFNRKWLLAIGAGIPQENIKYTDQWLFDFLDSGWFADAAMQGFFEAAKYGTFNVGKVIQHRAVETKEFKTVMQY